VDLLLDAGHRLAGAQEALLGGGDAAAFDEARDREQASVKRLRQAAEGILGERASPAMLERVVSTLRAASLSSDARAELARGRLTGEVSPPGFEAFAAGAPTRPAKARRATKHAGRREAVSRAQAEVKRAKERHATIAGQAREAERAVEAARESLASAEREAGRLRAEERSAASAVDAARAELEAARHPPK
jgi:hypothetical protein